MGRLLSIDYGKKRVGIAVTDELQIIATGLTTVEAKTTIDFLKDYTSKEKVDKFIVGIAMNTDDDSLSESAKYIEPFVKKLAKVFPEIPIERVDERYSSQRAFRAMIEGGLKKKARRNKALIDKISATIILQDYLNNR